MDQCKGKFPVLGIQTPGVVEWLTWPWLNLVKLESLFGCRITQVVGNPNYRI